MIFLLSCLAAIYTSSSRYFGFISYLLSALTPFLIKKTLSVLTSRLTLPSIKHKVFEMSGLSRRTVGVYGIAYVI